MAEKSLFKNSIYKAILIVVSTVILVFIGPYIARVLDINLYGLYNKAYSELQVFLIFASFGVTNYGIREISKIRNDKTKVSKLLTNLFFISCMSNVLVLIIYIFYSCLSFKSIELYIYLLIGIQIVGNIFYIEYVNEALENFKFITIKTFIVKMIYFICILLFVKKSNDILIYSIIIGMTVVINNIISYIIIRKRISFDYSSIKIRKYVLPLLYVLLINNIDLLYSQLDKIMLGHYVSPISVSIYFIPYYIILLVSSIPNSMISVSIPRLNYIMKNEGKQKYEEKINSIISPFLFFIIPICMGMFVLSKEIIIIYGSEKYMASVIPFAFMCLFRIIMSIGTLMVNLVMYPNNMEKKYIKYAFISGIINLILNYTLVKVKLFTPTTAFITTGLVETLLVILQYRFIKNKLKINLEIFSRKNLRYILLSILFVPISLLIRMIKFSFYTNIIVIIVSCCILYYAILYIIKDDNLNYLLNKAKIILRKWRKNDKS